MRRFKLVATLLIIALVCFLLAPQEGQTQPPRGGGGGGGIRFGGGGGMGFGMDPERIFDALARGNSTIRISDLQMGRDQAEEWARKQGISNGQLTKDQFIAYTDSS